MNSTQRTSQDLRSALEARIAERDSNDPDADIDRPIQPSAHSLVANGADRVEFYLDEAGVLHAWECVDADNEIELDLAETEL
jgi:hypothetical protein